MYDLLMEYQEHRCAICNIKNNKGKYFHLDHCNKTKEIRGLLCDNCNKGLGHFKDNPRVMFIATLYLDGPHFELKSK